MGRCLLGVIAVLISSSPAVATEPVSLVCAGNGAGPYYYTIDYDEGTVTMRDWGTFRATITDRQITWRFAENFNRLDRETGRLEISGPELTFVLQCNRGEPTQRF